MVNKATGYPALKGRSPRLFTLGFEVGRLRNPMNLILELTGVRAVPFEQLSPPRSGQQRC